MAETENATFIDKCAWCGVAVDTDAEPNAYVKVSKVRDGQRSTEWICICPPCRKERQEKRGQMTAKQFVTLCAIMLGGILILFIIIMMFA